VVLGAPDGAVKRARASPARSAAECRTAANAAAEDLGKMTAPTPASFLDFFVLEASEYVEQIDGLLARAVAEPPDHDSLQRAARALRGSATMAKLLSLAELAAAVESVGRALRQGAVRWDAQLKGLLTATVDELKILIRASRTWSPAQDASAMKRVQELSAYTSAGAPRTSSGAVTNSAFFSTEMTNIAAGLELLTTRPDDQGGAINVLRRVRALRGVAGVRDVRSLSEVLEGAENAVRPLENGEPLAADRISVLRAAAELLRAIAAALGASTSVRESAPEYVRFAAAMETLRGQEEDDNRVIAISELYYSDGGPHVISAAANPPTSPAQRFRMEVVSLGEHVMRLVNDARAATDELVRENARRDLGRVLRAIKATAASFAEHTVAASAESHLARAEKLNAAVLDALAAFAATISPRNITPTPSAPIAATPAVRREAPTAPAAPSTSHARVFAAPAAAPAASAAQGPPRRTERNTLDGAIDFFDSVALERFAEPVKLADDVVPVDALVYRGRAALDRAIELKDWLRKAGGAPSQEVLEELYDLLELARID
jgi:chemotaxis protein histidine kinase CheA